MKKTTRKSPSKASKKSAVKDLDVKPSKGGTVGGGYGKVGFDHRTT
jgi:hypothetical protein